MDAAKEGQGLNMLPVAVNGNHVLGHNYALTKCFSGRSSGAFERCHEMCVCNTGTQEIQRKEKLVAKSRALAASRARETRWRRAAGKVFLFFIAPLLESMTLFCVFCEI